MLNVHVQLGVLGRLDAVHVMDASYLGLKLNTQVGPVLK